MKFFASFPRKIVQEYGNVDIGLDIDPRDQRTNIIDPRDQEDPEKRRLRILNVVLTFQIRVGRINQHDKDLDWKSLSNLMYTEPEHKVKKNLNFPEDVKLNYWTREGKITKMIIRKPDKPEHFDNLNYWTIVVAFDAFHSNWLTTTVAEFMYEDRYLIAWYALWRKWPLFYPVWEWAGRFKEVRDALITPNYCKYFKDKYMEVIESGKCELIPKERYWSWSGHHMCQWDNPKVYHTDPCPIIAQMYPIPNPEDEMTETEKKYWSKVITEWKEVRNLAY